MSRVVPQRPGAAVDPAAAAAAAAAADPQDPTKGKPGRPKMDKTDYRSPDAELLKEWPADFDSAKHKPLKAEDFENQGIYWNKKADQYENRAKQCREKAEICERFGSEEERKAAQKFLKVSNQLNTLLETLKAQGVSEEDLAALKESMGK